MPSNLLSKILNALNDFKQNALPTRSASAYQKGTYWYISKTKLDMLKNGHFNSGPEWIQELSIKVSLGSAEVQASIAPSNNDIISLERLVSVLERKYDISSFEQVDQKSNSPFISFSGMASRLIDQEMFWVALRKEKSALLMVGSTSHVIGSNIEAKRSITPSVRPLQMVELAFGKRTLSPSSDHFEIEVPPEIKDHMMERIDESCAYIWSSVYGRNLKNKMMLPRVNGLAVLAGTLRVKRQIMGRHGHSGITHIVVASPIYVQQI